MGRSTLGTFQNGSFPLPLPKREGVFSDLHSKDLVEFLGVKRTKVGDLPTTWPSSVSALNLHKSLSVPAGWLLQGFCLRCDSLHSPVYLFRFQGDCLPWNLNSPMNLNSCYFQIIQLFSYCEDGTSNSQALHMLGWIPGYAIFFSSGASISNFLVLLYPLPNF